MSAAILLFSIEPLVGKVALPWFGGSAFVWTARLAFFQIALLVEYVYARAIAGRARASQLGIRGGLLLARPTKGDLPAVADHGQDLPDCESTPENIGPIADSTDAAVCGSQPELGARKGQEKGNVLK